ncbi:3-oxo-tetronate kinase [Paenibacillus allorhizoplanae]|uniref:3-oxo-tetronate kinase n=1 Tax=Paenibacillus allorhizoplanae TaxID=2905648 RepID=A0ABN8FYG3_9BACL|nr:four-carbon acid sugar kinase family protein [Paenibacillus allorhizoplanae]CAH1192497.1 3-oxo-tetronate kinase [Paenibacillus allorhizoplanae]
MIGIIADDITGANDIGIMYAKANIMTHVYPMEAWMYQNDGMQPEVLVLDTHSRLDTPEEAYNKVFQMTKKLKEAGCARFINKTCSVFRGNIGAEFDAMLDALEASFAIVVLAFPKNGRTTLDGIHYVHGKKLEESEFRNDPVHPMHESNLLHILQSQTPRRVGLITIDIIEQGSSVIMAEIIRLKNNGFNYLILDVRDQQSLQIIAQAVHQEPILCGSSALAEELALLEKPSAIQTGVTNQLPELGRSAVLCVAGSLMPQSAAQITYAKGQGLPALELDSLLLFDPSDRESHCDQIIGEASNLLKEGRDVLIHASNSPLKVAATKVKGMELGFDNTEVSELVSDALSDVIRSIVEETGQQRLLIAGGETSAAVCAKLGIGGLCIWQEIQPGLPSCLTLQKPERFLVLKSGSFGSEPFFIEAIEHLKQT